MKKIKFGNTLGQIQTVGNLVRIHMNVKVIEGLGGDFIFGFHHPLDYII
jgi:hypothetical protein